MDRVLARLFECIDREVGLSKCVIVLTADHGVAPLPELIPALRDSDSKGRIRTADMDVVARKALEAAFGPLPPKEIWFTRDNAGYHVRPSLLAAKNITATDVAKVLRDAIARLPYIAEVYTRDELTAVDASAATHAAMMRRSYREGSDRDVVYVFKPNFLSKSGSGTSHGTPYDYDTHVPQLWFGVGVPRGVHPERVGVDDIAPTLAGLLGVPVPQQGQGRRLF
jgi:arylsulfatase A-like enzyme